MSTRLRSFVVATAVATTALFVAAPAAFGGGTVTYSGTFEFQGLANDARGKSCSGKGAFGEMKPRARVTISERDAAGEFSTIAKSRVRRGKKASAGNGEDVCRVRFKAKARTAPADDSTVYLEVEGVTFDIRYPASEVVDGDLGTWTCEFSDTTCARVVSAD